MGSETKTRILIAGIGAVGGYFGGLLARQYETDPGVEIIFFARGSHLAKIQSDGLKVIGPKGEFICRPNIATDDANKIGLVDFIYVSTKSYGLEGIITQLKPTISNHTHIISLLNGVDSKGKIAAIVPEAKVYDGCVYIVSRIIEDGVVHNKGNIERLFFGTDSEPNSMLKDLQDLNLKAGIDSQLSDSISTIIWEKFIFISAAATSTSFFDKSIGAVVQDDDSLPEITKLLEEIIAVANAKGLALPDNIFDKAMHRLNSLSYDTTSSMHSDFQANRPTEVESLTGHVIKEGAEFQVPTPTYLYMYDSLKKS